MNQSTVVFWLFENFYKKTFQTVQTLIRGLLMHWWTALYCTATLISYFFTVLFTDYRTTMVHVHESYMTPSSFALKSLIYNTYTRSFYSQVGPTQGAPPPLASSVFQTDRPTPNCIKDFLDLPVDSGQSCLTLQQFPVVILANQVWRYNCFQWKQL